MKRRDLERHLVDHGCRPIREGANHVWLSHERLPDADTADEMKAWWRERLSTLKSQLEGGEVDA